MLILYLSANSIQFRQAVQQVTRDFNWENAMRAIFISYRREDAEGQAGRLFHDLVANFGDGSVFMDVAGIEPGRDFRRAIDEQVATCGVLLALIGTNWLDANDGSGRRRLDDPMDFVRLETASALKRDIPVIPVLVRGASMPRVEVLPEDLKELAFRNAVELTHARWDSDVQVLVKALRPHVQAKTEPTGLHPPSAQSEPSPTRTGPSRIIIAVLGSVLVLALVGYLWHQKSSEEAARVVEQTESVDLPIAQRTGEENTIPSASVEAASASTAVPQPERVGLSSTVAASGTLGSVVVLGTGDDLYYIYDASGEKQLGYERTGNARELFPGNYLVEVSGVKRPVTVRPGQQSAVQ
ncbi:MAG: toll/interleukin-1 receptor domain-containing protein [Gemmatimonadetes bacterium]|nr:toll/interleukin-1 receptor domain-containing protein [Gemmatimonadota bacterium]MBA4158087.1 toll/interleukin-1 receptor domain-containing protein [Gemmatimonadota bacterium]